MSEFVPANGIVHWLGAGLSTGSGLRVVCDLASRVSVWTRAPARAEQRLEVLGLSGRAAARTFDPVAFAAELGTGDVVVSMLPATEHLGLLQLCIARRAHFACSSYVSDQILAEAPGVAKAGIVALTEAGLDPGINHLLAHRLVALGRAAVGERAATATFTSYCGGLPVVPNPFRYRFSWAPRGVLTALCAPARYLEAGEERVAPRPWEMTRKHLLAGETFEVYPNRDSLPFVEQYDLPPTWKLDTFVRGTLRLDGWRDAWADTTWSGQYHLDAAGDRAESAMARCVSLPLAFGVAAILEGTLPPGLRRAAEDADEAAKWLEFLDANGIRSVLRASA